MLSVSIPPNPSDTIGHYQGLADELATLIKGPVVTRSNPAFFERSLTFNGKIKCLSKIVASPLDAQDVSAIIQFCTTHKLSPSVRAGGYGIAGWAVAGDLIINLGMIKEVDIEAPITLSEEEGGGVTWTKLRDMPLPGSKGKGRVGTVTVKATTDGPNNRPGGADRSPVPEPPHSIADSQAPRAGTPKRRREDRDVTPPPPGPTPGIVGGLPVGVDAHLHVYDSASRTTGVFLRGPPLPQIPGEAPREPPLNRRRLHSPVNEDPLAPETTLDTPALDSRQVSDESVTSSGKGSTSGSGLSREVSQGTAGTTPTGSPGGEKPPATAPHATTAADPFSYIASQPTSHPPVYGLRDPTGLGPSPAPTFSGVGTWQRSSGPGPSASIWSSGVSANSPFSAPNPFMSASPWPTTPGSFAMPMSRMMGMGGAPPAEPVHTHAYVTFGAGMKQKDVDLYSAEHPLEGISRVSGMREEGLVPYHVPSSAHPVGSSTMILAGFGFLSRLHGLSIDNLVEVEMVLADGRIVIVNEEDEPELWWAIRGGGPAFGIATRYKVKAFPVPVVFAGNLVYRFHRATAASLIKHFRDCIKGAPRELYANVLLTAGPSDRDSIVVIQMCYPGPKDKGLEFLQAISSWDGERCLLNEVNEKSFLNQQDSVAQVLRGKMGRQWFIRSSLIHSLPDEVINNTVLQFANTPIGCTWIFELAGGAIMDYEDNCLPKEQREATWTVAALHQWEMGIDDPRCITSAEDWMKDTIGPVALGGPYPTFLGRHEPPSRTMACYGKNWSRLAELKRKYDPNGLFKNNFWPLDKDGEPIELLYNEPPSPDME